MSAADGATPDDLAAEFPITPEEAQAIVDAMTPLQDITGVGDSMGSALKNVPGPGPKLVGAVLRNISAQVNLASQSAEVFARAISFYVESQTGSLDELFPPPWVVAEMLQQESQPALDIINRQTSGGGPFQPPDMP